MSEAKTKWDEVGDRFSELGNRFKDRYDASASFGKVQADQMNDAVHQIVDALDYYVGHSLVGPQGTGVSNRLLSLPRHGSLERDVEAALAR